MLKIDSTATASGTVTLTLEGRLIGPWVDELRMACKRTLDTSASLTLDPFDLLTAFHAAFTVVLRGLSGALTAVNRGGAYLHAVNPRIRELIT